MQLLLSLLALCAFLTIGQAQQTGEVDYPYLGIRFTIPPGWKGAETDGGFLIGSDTKPGLILMIPHEVKDLNTLKAEAKSGFSEEGIYLSMASNFENVGSGGVGAEFKGTIQGVSAKAYVIGVLNPFGYGVTIIATTDDVNYSASYKALARQVAMSLKFSHPKEPPFASQWKEALNGATLTYMNSSYSSSPSSDGYSSYSGYSSHIEITLCPSGNFSYTNSQHSSIDTGGSSMSSGNNGGGQGKWSLTGDAGGNNVLKLDFNTGKTDTYTLSYNNGKTYLNGKRYFRTHKRNCY